MAEQALDAPALARSAQHSSRSGAARWTQQPLARALLLPLVILLAWEAAAQAGWLAPNLMPAPSRIVRTIVQLATTGELFRHIAVTLWRVFVGFLLGAAAATLLGSVTGYSRTWRELLDPLLQSLRSIPSIAWVPLFILWLGIYEKSKVALIAVGVFFPVYLNLMSGIQNVDRKLVEVGRAYRLSGVALVRRVLLPATLPSYAVGLRGGLGLGWMFVVAAEYMGASSGLGFLLQDGQMTGRADIIIASIIMFAILGKLTDALLAAASRRLLSWQDTVQNHSDRQPGPAEEVL